MLRSGIFVSLIKDCFYKLKNTADLFSQSPVRMFFERDTV